MLCIILTFPNLMTACIDRHLPIMRVHSTHSDTPHFPFLYGQAAADSMRASLHKRYQLVVYHYSNSYTMFSESVKSLFKVAHQTPICVLAVVRGAISVVAVVVAVIVVYACCSCVHRGYAETRVHADARA